MLNGETVAGRRLRKGETLRETDYYLSTAGEWKPCPCPGVKLATDVAFFRPEVSDEL